MAKILLLFAHPALEKSRIHREFIKHIPSSQDIRLHDLYELYPDFLIDVNREQSLLLDYDIIIFQHPFYWYSAPAMIKQWQDLVLEHGWAYGSTGKMLAGKILMNIISCGGSAQSYQESGKNRYPVRDFLLPFEQTARLCNMEYWPPFVVHSTHKLVDTDIALHGLQYGQLLQALLADRISTDEKNSCIYINELLPIPATIQS